MGATADALAVEGTDDETEALATMREQQPAERPILLELRAAIQTTYRVGKSGWAKTGGGDLDAQAERVRRATLLCKLARQLPRPELAEVNAALAGQPHDYELLHEALDRLDVLWFETACQLGWT